MKIFENVAGQVLFSIVLQSAEGVLRMPVGEGTRGVTYSNPLGAQLSEIRKDTVWLAERPFYPRLPGLQRTDVACKAAIVRLKSGGLWIHAPVGLDKETKKAIDDLGRVEFIVSPNAEHVSYAQEWINAYPDALPLAPPYLQERFPHIQWRQCIPPMPEAWENEFDMVWIDAERVPLIGGNKPFFSEIVFCHKPSKCLFVTDLWWNYPNKDQSPANLSAPLVWKFAMDSIYRPVYNNILRVQPRHTTLLQTLLDFDFDCLVPCHGEPLEGPEVKTILRRFFNLKEDSY